MKFWNWFQKSLIFLIVMLLMSSSIAQPLDLTERIRFYTAPFEFNYAQWIIDSLVIKLGESGLDINSHLTASIQHRVVLEYFALAKQQDSLESAIEQAYTDPSISNPSQVVADKIQQNKNIQILLDELAPTVEGILQVQVTQIFAEQGIALGGQTIPPVLFHTTPLPKALIVSPRNNIQQDANISLLADLSLDQINQLETNVEKNLNVSALVVDIGGVGIYPTMVMHSSDLSWVMQTIVHEWTHNYLTLHPLGLNYDTNNDLRTMNETTASIVGDEVSQIVLKRFYPDWQASTISPDPNSLKTASLAPQASAFDFNTEMHTTRVTVDALLKEGKISVAESYMEARRQVFWDHGYLIRKLNQAYFAFYGAYAEVPGGAAGQDPVGPAVRALRAQSPSLAAFLKRIAWMSSFGELQKTVK
jgi:hypothetical protein